METPADKENHYKLIMPKTPFIIRPLTWFFKWLLGDELEENFYTDALSTKNGRDKRLQQDRLDEELKDAADLNNLARFDDYPGLDLYHFFVGDLGERLLAYFLRRERAFL